MVNIKKNNNGFTLIELLLSIALTSITLVIILGGLRLSLTSWEKGEERIDVYQRTRSVLNRISSDISSMVLFYYQKKNALKIKRYLAFIGLPNRISMIAGTRGLDSSAARQFGMQEVTYYLGTSKDGSQVLKRRERFVHPDKFFHDNNSIKIDLISEVAGFNVRYFTVKKDIYGKITPRGWSNTIANILQFEENASETKIKQILPAAVEVTLTLYENRGGEKIKRHLPPLVIPFNAGMEITKKIEL